MSGLAPSSSNVRCLNFAGQNAYAHVLQVGGHAHRPQAVGNLPEPILEVAGDAIVHPRFGLPRQHLAQLSVHGGARLFIAVEDERQVGDSQLGNAVGQVAARLIADGQHPVLDQPQDVLAAIAEVHDVVDVFHVDVAAEFGLQTVADPLQGQAEAGGRWSVTTHANLDRPVLGAVRHLLTGCRVAGILHSFPFRGGGGARKPPAG